MALFQPAIDFVLPHEGTLSNNPADPGGLTNFGISLKEHPLLGAQKILSLTRDDAANLYKLWYWGPNFDAIVDQGVANKLLDLVVNMGAQYNQPGGGIKILQQALRSFKWPTIVDGVFGPLSLQQLNHTDPQALLIELRAQAASFYCGLVLAKPSQQQFLLGWLRRACS